MATTRISSKGQIVIPKAIRDRQQWHEGTELEIEEKDDTVILHLKKVPQTASLHDLRGILDYRGPPVSVEEMDEAVARMFRETWRR